MKIITKITKKNNRKNVFNKTKKFFRLRDVKFDILPINKFYTKYICKKPEINGGHSYKIACNDKYKNNKIKYFLKIMSIPKHYDNFDFVLALNEVMSSMIYNKVFKLYGPILHLVYSEISSGLLGTNYLVATKYEDINKYSIHNYNFNDYKKGIIIDSIMANWDISVKGNYYQIDKNANNNDTNTKMQTRFLRLDLGGSLLFRALGEDKLPFINGSEPNEINSNNKFGWLYSDLKDEITPKNIQASYEYLLKLYNNGLFNELDNLRFHLLDVINNTILNKHLKLNEKYKHLATKLINFNVIQIKRRILWYINQYHPNITFTYTNLSKINITPKKITEYIYPIKNNIIPNEMPCKWTTNGQYPLPKTLINHFNSMLLDKKSKSIRIMTFNIGYNLINFNNTNSLYSFEKFLKDNKVDIECYQEMPYDTNFSSKLECNPNRTGNYGVNQINFNKNKLEKTFDILTNIELDNKHDDNGFELCNPKTKEKYARRGKCVNILELQFRNSKKTLLIYNVHLDVTRENKGRIWRIQSLKLILQHYEKIKNKYPNAIILGDLNTYNRTEYNINQLENLYKTKGQYAAENFLEMGIKNIDVLKSNGENQLFSDKEYEKLIPIDVLKYAGWNEAFEINGLPSPINTSHFSGKTDYIFLSPNWNLTINGLYTHYSTLTDHLPLFIDIDTDIFTN